MPGLPPMDTRATATASLAASTAWRRVAAASSGWPASGQHRHRSGDRRLGRLEPAFVAAHAVGECENGVAAVGADPGVPDVLVLGAHRSAIGDPGDLERLTLAVDGPRGAVVGHAPAPASAAAG